MRKMKVNVHLEKNSYDIHIGYQILPKFNFKKFNKSRYAIITDSHIANKYIGPGYPFYLKNQLEKQGLDSKIFSFEYGEQSKTPETAISLGRKLARNKFDRNSMIIALGGGVVGDMAGWIASFYMKGIDYIQIPTTLVAQVDSSIGGKTGVDIPEGKNLFGAFHQPKAVITDTYLLSSLDKQEWRNGLSEIIKYGVVLDEQLFRYLEGDFKGDRNFLNYTVRRCCKLKAKVIEKDEKEEEYRKILNYGHTIGHAIETSGEYMLSPHGEAIAIGMTYEGKLANHLGFFGDKDLKRQNDVMKHYWGELKYKIDADKLLRFMRLDKKNKSDEIYFVLPEKIGKAREINGKVAFPVDERIIRKILRD